MFTKGIKHLNKIFSNFFWIPKYKFQTCKNNANSSKHYFFYYFIKNSLKNFVSFPFIFQAFFTPLSHYWQHFSIVYLSFRTINSTVTDFLVTSVTPSWPYTFMLSIFSRGLSSTRSLFNTAVKGLLVPKEVLVMFLPFSMRNFTPVLLLNTLSLCL